MRGRTDRVVRWGVSLSYPRQTCSRRDVRHHPLLGGADNSLTDAPSDHVTTGPRGQQRLTEGPSHAMRPRVWSRVHKTRPADSSMPPHGIPKALRQSSIRRLLHVSMPCTDVRAIRAISDAPANVNYLELRGAPNSHPRLAGRECTPSCGCHAGNRSRSGQRSRRVAAQVR